eukprot:728266-Pelagomonas_calceolata.AAC.1
MATPWRLLGSLKNRPINLNTARDLPPFTTFKLTCINENAGAHTIPLSPLYLEKNDKAFCLIHSFNMALGKHIISGSDALLYL